MTIPTELKDKLPRLLSYPIGAEALTRALGQAPHIEQFKVSFIGNAKLLVPGGYRNWVSSPTRKVLVAQFRPASKPGISAPNSFIEEGWYDEKWELTVIAVLREQRHLVHQLLHEQGLPKVVDWLRLSQRPGWATVAQRIELVFNPADGSLSVEEFSGV
jgi:hypothetical protein